MLQSEERGPDRLGRSADRAGPLPPRGLEAKRGPWLGLGILAFALAVRLVYLYESAENPSFRLPTVDSQAYDHLARTYAQGQGISPHFFWQPFFYPLFLSGVYWLSHCSIVTAKVLQVLLGALTCVLAYRLGRMVFGRSVGVLAGLMTALYGPLIFFEGELLASGWAAFWSVLLVQLFLTVGYRRKLWLCFVLGACGALSIISRPTFLPFFVGGSLWLTLTFSRVPRPARSLAAGLLTLLAGFSLVAAPVAWQCARVTGRPRLLPSSGGINLYIGNNPNVCDTLTARPGSDWNRLAALPFRLGITDMWDQSRFFGRRVWAYALSDPLGFAAGLGRKSLQFLNSREIPRNVDVYVFTKWSWVLRSLVWKAGGFGFPFGVALPLAVVGLLYFRQQVPAPLWLFLLLYPLAIILVFVSARYRVAVVPVVLVAAAAGLSATLRMFRNQQWRWVVIAVGCAAGVLLVSSLPGPFCEEQPNFEAELYRYLADAQAQRGQHHEAVALYSDALRLNPESPEAHCNLGNTLVLLGKFDQAVAHYREALRLKPDFTAVHRNLATVLQQRGTTE